MARSQSIDRRDVEMRVALIGSTKSGKTTYLAALTRAEYYSDAVRAPLRVRGLNDNGRDLFREAAAIITGRQPTPTPAVMRYELTVELPGILPAFPSVDLGRASLTLGLSDPPGGDCLPELGEPPQIDVVQELAAADAVLLLVSADLRFRPADFPQRLTQLFGAVKTQRDGDRRFLFNRIALVMTMCELSGSGDATVNVDQLDACDPVDVIAERFGPDIIAAVRDAVPAGGDWYGLASAYGFNRKTRLAAAEKDTAGNWKLPFTPNSADAWWPYRVAEPIEFLARGMCWQERIAQ